MKAISKKKEHVHIEGKIKIRFHNHKYETENKQEIELLKQKEGKHWFVEKKYRIKTVPTIEVPEKIEKGNEFKPTLANIDKPLKEYPYQKLLKMAKNSGLKLGAKMPTRAKLTEMINFVFEERGDILKDESDETEETEEIAETEEK